MKIDQSAVLSSHISSSRVQNSTTGGTTEHSGGKNNTFDESFSKADVQQVVDHMNEISEPVRTNLKFELHDTLERYYITVVDAQTEEVVKEIPPKKMLDMYAAMAELMGLLVDKKI